MLRPLPVPQEFARTLLERIEGRVRRIRVHGGGTGADLLFQRCDACVALGVEHDELFVCVVYS